MPEVCKIHNLTLPTLRMIDTGHGNYIQCKLLNRPDSVTETNR